MITQVSTIEELKQIFVEVLLSKTDKVTKVSDESVLSGISYGVAKVGQKVLKEIAILEGHLFPDAAFGDYLDNSAEIFGVAQRFESASSYVYARVVGNPGTAYVAGTHIFSGASGITFSLQQNLTLGSHGWGYVKLRSDQLGDIANVDALTITKISPVPVGHRYVINEYKASGGRDIEQDDYFRKRIKEGANILAKGTLAMLEQVFMKINTNILKVYHQGFNENGEVILAVATQNGVDLTQQERDDLLEYGQAYFSLVELQSVGGINYGIQIKNVVYQLIDVSFRCDLWQGYSADDVRKDIQVKFSKYFDYRYWSESKGKVEWDNLLQLVKNTRGVRYVPDTYFTPNSDVAIEKYKLPLMRGFIMMDLDGNIISNVSGTLQPLYYPNNPDFSYWATILSDI